jgi:type II secretory pathway pseudopilin PulG
MMRYQNKITASYTGLTLLEMVIAIAIMTIIFTAILPLFASIRNSWDTKQANAELLQNGRVLIDHLNRNLSKAVKVTEISDSSETDGYFQFEDNDGNNWRYEIGDDDYVQFGAPGDLYDLAGPVSTLQFTCYGPNDFNNPTTDVNSIRFVTIQTTLTNPAVIGQDKTLTTSVYLRTSYNRQAQGLVGWWKLDETSGLTAADSSGSGNDGTLTNMAGNEWTDGILNGALEFAGYNDYVQTTSNESKTSTDFTWACWFKADTTIGIHHLVWEGKATENGFGGSASNTHEAHINIGAPYIDNVLGCFYGTDEYGAAPDVIRIETSFSDTTNWHHVAFVVTNADSSPSGELFLDGVSVGNDTGNQTDRTNWDTDLRIGRPGANERYFDGTIDDVRIYNRALEYGEISQLLGIVIYEDFNDAKVDSDEESITIDAPTDTCEEDLLIAAIATDGDTSTPLAPSDESWTTINVDADDNAEVTLGAWWKLADASGPTSHEFTWSAAGGQQAYGWIMRFTGHNPDSPINNWSANSDLGSSPTSPAVITTVDNCLILRLGAFDDDDIEVNEPGLPGHTPITMDNSGSGTSSGTVGHWMLDETSGTTAADSSGNGNNGTLYGSPTYPTWVAGQIGNALRFDGTNDYVSLPIGSVINSLTNCTIATWVNWSGNSTWQRIWDFGTGETVNMFLTPKNGSNNRLRFAITVSSWGGEEQTTGPAVLPSGWHHVTVTIDADNHTHKLYLDGSPVAQNTSGSLDPSDLGNTNLNRLGRSQYSADPYFYGKLDDVRIYNFALSPEEVDELAQWSGGSSGTVSGGAGYVKQSSSGDSGTSNFSLGSQNEAQMLTIAIEPNPQSQGGGGIRP